MFTYLYTHLVKMPLHTLYFSGPTMLGFWGGAQFEDICYSLTGTTAGFWVKNYAQCAQLCAQKFDAFTIIVVFVLYAFAVHKLSNALTFYLCFTRPVLSELHTLRFPHPKLKG